MIGAVSRDRLAKRVLPPRPTVRCRPASCPARSTPTRWSRRRRPRREGVASAASIWPRSRCSSPSCCRTRGIARAAAGGGLVGGDRFAGAAQTKAQRGLGERQLCAAADCGFGPRERSPAPTSGPSVARRDVGPAGPRLFERAAPGVPPARNAARRDRRASCRHSAAREIEVRLEALDAAGDQCARTASAATAYSRRFSARSPSRMAWLARRNSRILSFGSAPDA